MVVFLFYRPQLLFVRKEIMLKMNL